MITFKANVRNASARTSDVITSRSVGIPVRLVLDREFDGLEKTVVFKAGKVSVDIVLAGDAVETVLPPDVLNVAGQRLFIGIYAADSQGNTVIPTIWASVATIQSGVVPSGVNPDSPTPSWVAQVQSIANEAVEVANSVRTDADNGVFDGAPGQNGTNGTNGKDGATVWNATGSPASVRWDSSHIYMGWTSAQLSGRSGLSPAAGDLVFRSTMYYPIAGYRAGYYCVNPSSGISIKGDTGSKGDTGAGVVIGGTTGQALLKKSDSNYDTEWGSVFPAIPESDGEYILKVTVSGGQAVYSWVAQN